MRPRSGRLTCCLCLAGRRSPPRSRAEAVIDLQCRNFLPAPLTGHFRQPTRLGCMANDLLVCNLGTVEYTEAAALQERLRAQVIAGELPDLMLLLEHPPVYTVGRRSEEDELPHGS